MTTPKSVQLQGASLDPAGGTDPHYRLALRARHMAPSNLYSWIRPCSGDMIGAHQKLNGLRDLITPLSGIVCHPWASTCYDQPI